MSTLHLGVTDTNRAMEQTKVPLKNTITLLKKKFLAGDELTQKELSTVGIGKIQRKRAEIIARSYDPAVQGRKLNTDVLRAVFTLTFGGFWELVKNSSGAAAARRASRVRTPIKPGRLGKEESEPSRRPVFTT